MVDVQQLKQDRKAWLAANLTKGNADRRKLTAEQVHEIRFGKEKYAELARRYGVTYNVIQMCGACETYKDYPANPDRPSGRRSSLLTETQVREIRARAEGGESSSSIAKDYPINRRHVSKVVSGMSYKWVR